MQKYAILLRGINVGGKNKFSKDDFKSSLERFGFSDVSIYINSGNAVASIPSEFNPAELELQIENSAGFFVPTLVLPESKIKVIANSIPASWTNDAPSPDRSGQKSDVLYLFDEINNLKIVNELIYDPKIENIVYVDGALLTNISRQNQSKSSLLKLMGTKMYRKMTIRNINTAKKLAELMT